ncbi:hypothetical protein PF010_g28684 [Phytophthora fragariae]|uniref:CCHC-type domain-containing protein n=3 Tax=Phytophthora fragariae TaxID=53985 RepID=A0A6G0JQU5_9STRA|nr:hypothetical protein PF010_g28684 [Phytophthora fragariae]
MTHHEGVAPAQPGATAMAHAGTAAKTQAGAAAKTRSGATETGCTEGTAMAAPRSATTNEAMWTGTAAARTSPVASAATGSAPATTGAAGAASPQPVVREQLRPYSGPVEPSAARTTTTTATRAARRPSSPGGSGDSSSSGSSDSFGSDDSRTGHRRRRGRRHRRRRSSRSTRRRQHRKNAKDLELTPYKPSPTVSVSTWIAKVDLAVEGARISGRGDWTDAELYFIVGNMLQDNAAGWWVQMDQELPSAEKTWTKLKSALMRRYGERPDQAMAEWRVYQRMMYPGETFADFAAGLRDLTGQNHVSERTLLAQCYRNLDKTTRMLVKQDPVPVTLEQAVDKATAIDDPIGNVAQGMLNTGQAWATAPNAFAVPMNGTTGNVAIVPGVGVGVGPTNDSLMAQMGTDSQEVAFFTNPQGVYNKYTGTWDVPEGRFWNGRYWQPTKKNQQSRTQQEGRSGGKRGMAGGDKRAKVCMVQAADDESSDGSATEAAPQLPQRKKQKAVVRKTKGAVRLAKAEPQSADTEQKANRWPNTDTKCYVCGGTGHFARECPDPEARAQNDAYLASRAATQGSTAENADRA